MLSVGETLRRARLEQRLDLCAVAAQTKISARYLEAIESGDRKILPSGFFYKSFVDQYAKFLSLDTKEIDAEVDRVLSADEPLRLPGFESVAARDVPPITFAHRFHTRLPYASAASLVGVLVGCSAVYAWWHAGRSSVSLKGMIDKVRVFDKPAKAVTSSKIQKRPAAPSAEEAGNIARVTSAAASDYKVMLDLMAREATWLSVSSDGKPVFSGVLQANQTKSVEGKQFAKVRVGNAAGLDVRLNGKLLAPLGARGQVLIVLFTPDNFQIVSPPKESD